MALSFEELADAGSGEMPIKKKLSIASIVLFLLLFCVAGVLGFLIFKERDPVVTEAATILLAVDNEVEHTVDEATEFKESLNLLQPGIKEPAFREPKVAEEPSAVVKIQPELVQVRERHPETAELVEVASLEEVEEVADVKSLDDLRTVVHGKLGSNVYEVNDQRFDRDWGGLVLVPNKIRLAKAHTTGVQLVRVEAHPIKNERLRVWTRVENITTDDIELKIGCEFRSVGADVDRPIYEPVILAAGGVVDAFFDSPKDRVQSYTVLVKREF